MQAEVIKGSSVETNQYGAIGVKQLLNRQEVPEASVAIIELDGVNRPTLNREVDSFYYVISGSGWFTLNGRRIAVEAGDLVCVPKNTKYFDEGKMTMITFGRPRFTMDQVVENPEKL